MPTRRANVIAKIITFTCLLKVSVFNPALVAQPKPIPTGGQSASQEKVRTMDFCRLIRQPYRYMNQTVRITARWEIIGEAQYLNGIHCRADYIERLRTGFAAEQDEATRQNLSRVQSPEFDNRAMVTVVGSLQDPSRGEGHSLNFEILRFESITPLESTRDIDFCDLVRQPQRFFARTVRIKAIWQQGVEFSYLNGVGCPSKPRQDIAAVWLDPQDPKISKMMSREFAGRANITAVGTLRDPGKYYGYFRYLFEISRLEDVAHVVVPYQGMLEPGKTYRAVLRGDGDLGLILVPALRVRLHEAVSIDWTNLNEFPALEKLRDNSQQQQIVFSVISDQRTQMTAQRWNRALECKIIRIE